jgi:hypothetical protein
MQPHSILAARVFLSFVVSSLPVLVVHTCNPSYSGGRDQEDHDWKTAQANKKFVRPYLKKNSSKRAGGVAGSRCRP